MEYNEELQIEVDNFIEERIQENYKKIMEIEKNKKALKNYYNLFNQITEIINNHNLTSQYKETEFDICSIQLKEAYKLGFKDSITIFMTK